MAHSPRVKKIIRPRAWESLRALRSPCSQRSKDVSPVTNLRSKAAMAPTMSSIAISSTPIAANALRYRDWDFTRATASSSIRSISIGLVIGPLACSSSDSARPSQKKYSACCRLTTVGVLIGSTSPWAPFPKAMPCSKPCSGLWHVPHEVFRGRERMGSKKSRQPIASWRDTSLPHATAESAQQSREMRARSLRGMGCVADNRGFRRSVSARKRLARDHCFLRPSRAGSCLAFPPGLRQKWLHPGLLSRAPFGG